MNDAKSKSVFLSIGFAVLLFFCFLAGSELARADFCDTWDCDDRCCWWALCEPTCYSICSLHNLGCDPSVCNAIKTADPLYELLKAEWQQAFDLGAFDNVEECLDIADKGHEAGYYLCDFLGGGLFCDLGDAIGREESACICQELDYGGGGSANQPPEALCQDVTVLADAQCQGCGSVDNGSFDPEGAALSIVPDPGCPYPLGETSVTLLVSDGLNPLETCSASLTVVDITPPDIQCDAPATITPPDAPISFTATSTDNCSSDSLVEIIDYDCFQFTKKGRRIDKTESCIVEVYGDTITIVDSGGVNDNISWTVRATDDSGNVSESTCSIVVVGPVQN